MGINSTASNLGVPCIDFKFPFETSIPSWRQRVRNAVHLLSPKTRSKLKALQRKSWCRKIIPLLASAEPPTTTRAQKAFSELQKYSEAPAEYGYGKFDVWKRGVTRAESLMEMFGLKKPVAEILEVGGGDGMTASELATYGHQVTMTDLEDWRDSRVDSRVSFVKGAIESGLQIRKNLYDLVYSYNTFEHVENPKHALNQMLEWSRPNGFIYLDFGPLFASPWGLHAYRSLHMPYPQYLFSEEFIQQRLFESGIRDLGQTRNSLQPLNRWSLTDFKKLAENSTGELVWWCTEETFRHLHVILEFPEAFSGRNLTFEDVTRTLIRMVLKKAS